MITEFSNTRQRAFSIGLSRRDVVRRRDLRQLGGLPPYDGRRLALDAWQRFIPCLIILDWPL